MRKILITSILVFAAAAFAQADPISYLVTVNTASINTQYGYIDFLLNPGGQNTEALTAVITNFTPAAALNPADPNNFVGGNVTGSLPGPLTITNTNADNEYLEGLTFGNTITFDLSLDGPALTSPNGNPTANGTTFAISLYDSTSFNYLLPPTGPAGTLIVDYLGNVETNSAVVGNTPIVTFTPQGPVVTPEPSAFMPLLALSGLAGACASRGKYRRGLAN